MVDTGGAVAAASACVWAEGAQSRLRNRRGTPAEALFLEYAESAGSMLSPEVFPRADGTAYVCGISSKSLFPTDPAGVAPDDSAIERLKALCDRMSPVLAGPPSSPAKRATAR